MTEPSNAPFGPSNTSSASSSTLFTPPSAPSAPSSEHDSIDSQTLVEPWAAGYQDLGQRGYRFSPGQSPYVPSQNPYEPPPGDATTQYSRELIRLDKIYKMEDKFGDTGDNFRFKIIIFYDKCMRAGLPPIAYIQGASIMLSGQALFHYYENKGAISSWEEFCMEMQLFFEGPEWQRLILTKWQTINLADVISANPTLSTIECIRKLCTELSIMQKGIDPAYHGPVHLRDNIVRACRGHPALIDGLTNPPLDKSELVNSLHASIVNYEAVHKTFSMQQNYMQHKGDNDYEDAGQFFKKLTINAAPSSDRDKRRQREWRPTR